MSETIRLVSAAEATTLDLVYGIPGQTPPNRAAVRECVSLRRRIAARGITVDDEAVARLALTLASAPGDPLVFRDQCIRARHGLPCTGVCCLPF